MTAPVVVITRPRRRRLAGTRRRLRGTAAVIALVLSAADVLLSALTGWPRAAHVGRELGRAIADAWHRGARTIAPPRIYVVSPDFTREDTTDDHH